MYRVRAGGHRGDLRGGCRDRAAGPRGSSPPTANGYLLRPFFDLDEPFSDGTPGAAARARAHPERERRANELPGGRGLVRTRGHQAQR